MNGFLLRSRYLISFSGGRTSAYMLKRIIDAHGGTLPDYVKVAFANTGKERPETLDFVEECSRRWAVPITWVERFPDGFRIVTHETASRNGEPFAAWIEKRKYLPNPVARFCTVEMKIRGIRDWLRTVGWSDESYYMVIGFRADEPQRVAKWAKPNKEGKWGRIAPLHEAGITKEPIMEFWAAQDFDLQLAQHEGNCDLCFLKGRAKRIGMIRDTPAMAVWWLAQEAKTGGTFRSDSSYADLALRAGQPSLLDADDDLDVREYSCETDMCIE